MKISSGEMFIDSTRTIRAVQPKAERIPGRPCWYILLILLLAGASAPADAQWTMGARSIAMGQAHTALADDAWAVFHNPAALPGEDVRISFFSIRYYGLRELEDHAAAVSVSVPSLLRPSSRRIALGTGIHTYGFELFRETRARLAVAAVHDRLRIGLSASYVHMRIPGYGSRGSPVLDAGIIAELTDTFLIGYRMTHLLPSADTDTETDRHPAEIAAGIGWRGIRGLVVTADMVKDSLHPLALRSGAELTFPGPISLRGGWTSRPFTWSAGAGIRLDPIRGNLAVQKHDILGLSPGFDIQITL